MKFEEEQNKHTADAGRQLNHNQVNNNLRLDSDNLVPSGTLVIQQPTNHLTLHDHLT